MSYGWPADPETLRSARAEFDREGFVVFEGVMDAEMTARVRAALAPHLAADRRGRNDFEGVRTRRVYALLAKDPVFAEIAAHPLALHFAEAELGPNCLLASALAIDLGPGESVQPWHTDDGYITVPPPRPAYGVSTFWAVDATTSENGATQVIPGSHLWGEDGKRVDLDARGFFDASDPDPDADPAPHPDMVHLELPAGAVAVTKGNLWHRGGANRTDANRLILTPQYCASWARPLESMLLAVPPEIVAGYPPRVQELLGYSIAPPFMGYVDGVHPRRTLPAHDTANG